MRNFFAFITLAAALICGDAAFAQSPPFNSTSIGTLGGNCTQQGAVIYQSASGQSKCLPAGTSGYTLRANGAGSDVTWSLVTGTGTVTSVGMTVPTWLTVTGSPVTGAGTLAVTATATTPANQILASPNGSAGAVAPRALVGADLPVPSASTLGGTESLTCTAGQFWSALATTGVPTCSALASSALTPVLGSTRGAIAEYGSGGWTAISPSATIGAVLTSAGTGNDPSYTSVVNSVANSTQVNFSATTGASITASLNYETIGYRNRLFNGDFRVNITAVSGSGSLGCTTACNYFSEGWFANSTGAAATATQGGSGILTGYQNEAVLSGVASNTSAYIAQRIESLNTYDLASKSVSISVDGGYCSSAQTIQWALYTPNLVDGYSAETIVTSGTWSFSTTQARYTATATLNAAAINGLELRLYANNGGAFTSGGSCVFGGVQLEPGAYATAFERLPYDTQYLRANRFVRKIGGSVTADVALQGYTNAGNAISATFTYPEMFGAPVGAVVGTWTNLNVSTSLLYTGKTSVTLQLQPTASGPLSSYTNGTSTYLTITSRL